MPTTTNITYGASKVDIGTLFDSLTTTLNSLTNTVNNLSTTVNGLTNTVNNSTNTVNNLSTTVNGLTNTVNNSTNTVNGLTNTVNTINTRVNKLLNLHFFVQSASNNSYCTTPTLQSGLWIIYYSAYNDTYNTGYCYILVANSSNHGSILTDSYNGLANNITWTINQGNGSATLTINSGLPIVAYASGTCISQYWDNNLSA